MSLNKEEIFLRFFFLSFLQLKSFFLFQPFIVAAKDHYHKDVEQIYFMDVSVKNNCFYAFNSRKEPNKYRNAVSERKIKLNFPTESDISAFYARMCF